MGTCGPRLFCSPKYLWLHIVCAGYGHAAFVPSTSLCTKRREISRSYTIAFHFLWEWKVHCIFDGICSKTFILLLLLELPVIIKNVMSSRSVTRPSWLQWGWGRARFYAHHISNPRNSVGEMWPPNEHLPWQTCVASLHLSHWCTYR